MCLTNVNLSKNLFNIRIEKSYVYGHIKNLLPIFSSNISEYSDIYKNKKVINYFKRFYPFQRLHNIERFIKGTPYYNKAFLDSVSHSIGLSKKIFIDNLSKAQSIMSTDKHVKVSYSEHEYAVNCLFKFVFNNTSTTYRPSFGDVLDAINLKASTGLPKPWVSKRQSIGLIKNIYDEVKNERFCIIKAFNNIKANESAPLTAAFVRMQITNSGLKVRLVFAVALIFLVAETYFNLILKYVVNNVQSTAIHGYTQPRIRDLVSSTNELHTLCIDYKSFDQKMPSFIIITCAYVSRYVMNLNAYENVLFFNLINFFVKLPVFHPLVPFVPKNCGIPSGSGFTSIFGSLCNTYMLHIAIRRYCKENRISDFEDNYIAYTSSDDTIISSSFYIDFMKLKKILLDLFGVDIELESYSCPGQTEVFFLGSRWINNLPTRDVDRMVARIIFGSGNYPQMTDLELFQSRCFEILGNTCQYASIYRTFNVPYPKRVFRLIELADYITQQYIKDNLINYEKRGFWMNIRLDHNTANLVWLER